MKPTTKYFDAPRMIAAFEQDSGEMLSQRVKELIVAFEDVINIAYEHGFEAGMEAAHA